MNETKVINCEWGFDEHNSKRFVIIMYLAGVLMGLMGGLWVL